MAIVDFSHAVIECKNQTAYRTGNLCLDSTSLTDGSQWGSVANDSVQVQYGTDSATFVHTGTFTASGTEFYIREEYWHTAPWKISNINFDNGDTYSFQLTLNITT